MSTMKMIRECSTRNIFPGKVFQKIICSNSHRRMLQTLTSFVPKNQSNPMWGRVVCDRYNRILHMEPKRRCLNSGNLRELQFTPCEFSCQRSCSTNQKAENLEEEALDIENDEEITSHPELQELEYLEKYLLPADGHRVLIIQPDYKEGRKKVMEARHQLAEACGLVDALPGWHVTDTAIYSLKVVDKKYVYGKGNFQDISRLIKRTKHITAVFFAIDLLSGLQVSVLQREWGLPVYDRYSIVLQIFKLRAASQEAKLQVALAEIPFYRSRLVGLHQGTLDQQRGGLGAIGGGGEKQLEMKSRILQVKENKMRKALSKVRSQRHLVQTERRRKEFPVVAVVGYTNAGKTSIIKSLTGEKDMEPMDQVFATLDVTCHGATLPNHLRVMYLDTVGFISDIPTALVHSFNTVLEDIKDADVILHVRDISHPDTERQRQVVLDTLNGLHLPQRLLDNMVEVCNKVDLLDQSAVTGVLGDGLGVSAVRGTGLMELGQQLQTAVIAATNRLEKRLKIPLNGPHLNWLYKESDIQRTVTLESDPESLIVEAVMTQAAYAKFCARFRRKKTQTNTK